MYPFFLAFFYQFKSTPLLYFIIQMIQALLSLLTVFVVYKTAKHLFGQFPARIIEVFCGLYPPLIYYSTKLVPTTLFLFLLSFTIYMLLDGSERLFLYYILTGILLGLTVLCDPVALILYPSVFIWFLITKKVNFFKILVITIVSFVILLPWTIRNYRTHESFVPITTQFGVNFWIGNNPYATGTDYFKVISQERREYILMTETLPKALQDSLNRLSEIERSNFYFNRAIDFIKNNPLKFLFLLVKKGYYYFWFAPSEIYYSQDLERYRILYYFLYLPVLISGFAGIFLSIKNHNRDVSLILAVCFFISGLYIFTHVGLIRYRLPVELYFLFFGGYFISSFKK
ncbi:MAG: glycosyltransferase family 39 protein [candidate division WOR-3 bacterium]|nr:glycosyltransferase family 39 protein [candidate division WOR-3 bacterium]